MQKAQVGDKVRFEGEGVVKEVKQEQGTIVYYVHKQVGEGLKSIFLISKITGDMIKE